MRKDRPSAAWIVAVAVLLAGCTAPVAAPSPSPEPSIESIATAAPLPTPEATPDPAAPCKDCWPLTGKPLKVGAVDKRPLVVKIDNVPLARPHYGITQADMVFEIVVEGLTDRRQHADKGLAFDGKGGVYVNIGAPSNSCQQPDRQPKVAGQDPCQLLEIAGGVWRFDESGYYRVNFRPGPYDMFTSAAAMRQAMAAKGGDGPQQVPSWGFLADPDHAPTIAGMTGASVATDITIPYREDSSRVQYKYDAKTRTYGRWQNSASKAVRDVDGVNNQPVAASNVVIIHTEIWEVPQIVDAGGAHAHDMRLVGAGAATIFRDGLRQEGTWARATESDLFTFKNAAGEQILFDQGQTWVHVVPNEWEITSQQ